MAFENQQPEGTQECIGKRPLVTERHQSSRSHPRDGVPAWRWYSSLLTVVIASIAIGFDISNVATIQATIYETFLQIDLLPWVGLSYAMAQASCLPLIRKLSDLVEYHVLAAFGALVFATGSAVAGAAPSMAALIVGRVLAGVGGACMLQSTGVFLHAFTALAERSIYQAGIGLFWIVGMLLGPVVSAAFAGNPATTWRWSFYIVIPFIAGLVFPLSVFALPHPPQSTASENNSHKPLRETLAAIDWVGALLLAASIVLWDFMTLSCGTLWPWSSGASIATCVITCLVIVALVLQQLLSLFTTPTDRLLPVDLLTNRTVLLVCISTFMMSTTYSIALYYTPLFFAFARGTSAIETALHTMPFLGTFIGTVLIAGVLVPVLRRYAPMYLTAGAFMVAASSYLVTITPSSSDSSIMACTAILGAAAAICWPIGLSVNSFILQKERAADVAMLNNFLICAPSAIILGMAGCMFENMGLNELKDALGNENYSDDDIRQVLAGLSSPIWLNSGPDAAIAIQVLTHVIQEICYILLAAGIILVVAAVNMKWEALDFRGKKNENGGEL